MIALMTLKCSTCCQPNFDAANWHRGFLCESCRESNNWTMDIEEIDLDDGDTSVLRYCSIEQQILLELVTHCKGNDTPIDTINRILKEQLTKLPADQQPYFPYIMKSNFKSNFEWFSQQSYKSLKITHSRTVPAGREFNKMILNLPVVIFQNLNINYIVDGNTRINRRLLDKTASLHPAYTLERV